METAEHTGAEYLKFRLGNKSTDAEWDEFLENNPDCHFEQSSSWAYAKSFQGWTPLRIEITCDHKLTGGFQILFRNKGPARIGYISKGPILSQNNPDVLDYALNLSISFAKKQKIAALLIQLPDSYIKCTAELAKQGFSPNYLYSLIEATLLISGRESYEDILAGVNRYTRRKIRQGISRGVKIREGSIHDLTVFFNLMCASCKRQENVKPNPSTEAALRHIWEHFNFSPRLRLTFAEINGKKVSGLLSILFGKKITFWKKGWNSECSSCHPNEVLYSEAIKWAHDHGYQIYDFYAFDKRMAQALLNGNNLTEAQKKSRHFFNLCFGGTPALLPKSYIWISNPFLRKCYDLFKFLQANK